MASEKKKHTLTIDYVYLCSGFGHTNIILTYSIERGLADSSHDWLIPFSIIMLNSRQGNNVADEAMTS